MARGLDEIERNINYELNEGNRLQELGEKFVEDKEKLEDKIDQIKANNKISKEVKEKLIYELEEGIDNLEEQYESDITKMQEEHDRQLQEMISELEDQENELNEESGDISGIRGNIGVTDSTVFDTSELAKQERDDFYEAKVKSISELNQKKERANKQKEKIKSRRR